MALRPVITGRIAAAMPQQEGEQLLPSPHQVHGCADSCPDQISKRFVCGVWNPHWRQVTRAVQNCSFSESRRSVLIRSPGLRGIMDGAATVPCARGP
jgi:hypothetical protein